MFALTDELPWTVEINGKSYDIDLSFDNVLRVIDMLNDKELADYEQIIIGLKMLIDSFVFSNYTPEECATIFLKLFEEFIDDNSEDAVEYDLEGNPMPKVNNDNDENVDIYDLKQDAPYIYASFMQDYGIDLFKEQGKMHWWQFKALLTGLSDDTKFKKVLEIRSMELPSGKGTEKQRKAIQKLKKAYALKPKSEN